MNIIDKKSHNELINILNELITTIELMRTEKKDYLLNQNQEEAKEWLKFLCEHTDKEELKTLEDEIANRFVFKFDVEIDTGELDGRRVKENLEADFDYFKEKKIDLNSLQFTQFDSDCTHYVYISDGNGNGITYYITVKDGKYKLDLRYRM